LSRTGGGIMRTGYITVAYLTWLLQNWGGPAAGFFAGQIIEYFLSFCA
jgi:hypothetical protein